MKAVMASGAFFLEWGDGAMRLISAVSKPFTLIIGEH